MTAFGIQLCAGGIIKCLSRDLCRCAVVSELRKLRIRVEQSSAKIGPDGYVQKLKVFSRNTEDRWKIDFPALTSSLPEYGLRKELGKADRRVYIDSRSDWVEGILECVKPPSRR